MIDFINLIAPYLYAFTIVFSIIFGVSLAVSVWVSSIISNMKKVSIEKFNSELTLKEIQQVNFAIDTAKINLSNIVQSDKKHKKNKSKNYPKNDEDSLKKADVFKALLKDVYEPFSVSGDTYRSYLSFTKNEIFSIAKSLLSRVDKILSNSDVKFVKKIKISYILMGKDVYDGYTNLLEKFWVNLFKTIIDFFLWVFRIVSPASLTKYIVKELTNQGIVLQFWSAIVEITGMELAVIYKEERFKTAKNLQNNKKAG